MSIITATNSIHLKMNGTDIQYNADSGGFTTISTWPVTITNGNTTPGPSAILNVIVTEDLTISSNLGGSGYFITGSQYITFDGAGYAININGVGNYPGFIQNGRVSAAGKSNVVVKNFTTNVTLNSGSTLGSGAGWLCQEYFGRGVPGNLIENCTNNGVISSIGAGGIAGQYAGYRALLTITGCTNNGSISGQYAGGIAGQYAGQEGRIIFIGCTNTGPISEFASGGICGDTAGGFSGSATFTSCTNTSTGTISGIYAGGICGGQAGTSGSATFTSCTNSGLISGQAAGGISGAYAGTSGSATFTSCTNTSTGSISGSDAGGIAGSNAGSYSGSATFASCANSGEIIGQRAGGIVGVGAGFTDGLVELTTCFSTGNITGQFAGGIAGYLFTYNTNRICSITDCYSTGQISGDRAGGITGANIGYCNNVTYNNMKVNITNCYSLGTISVSCGGICGGFNNANGYFRFPTINIINCYSYGTIGDVPPNSGIVALSLTSTSVNFNNYNLVTYVANNNWTDASANARLTGTPNSPGVTWSSIVTGEPYVLSAYDAQIYSPNSTSSSSNYTSSQGLFQPGFTYDIVYSNQVGSTLTLYVAAYKGTSPDFTDYNINTFTITNANGSNEPIPSSINPSNGILYITLLPTTPTPPVQRLAVGGGGGAFWFGEYGFLYKRKGGGGGRRSTKMAPGGNTTCNGPTYIYNKYNPGNTGVGAQSTAVRRAKNIKAAVCGPKIPCGQFYNYLGLYDNYTGNPNGYVVYPRSNF